MLRALASVVVLSSSFYLAALDQVTASELGKLYAELEQEFKQSKPFVGPDFAALKKYLLAGDGKLKIDLLTVDIAGEWPTSEELASLKSDSYEWTVLGMRKHEAVIIKTELGNVVLSLQSDASGLVLKGTTDGQKAENTGFRFDPNTQQWACTTDSFGSDKMRFELHVLEDGQETSGLIVVMRSAGGSVDDLTRPVTFGIGRF